MQLTPAERKLLDSADQGRLWYVPAQSRMVGRLVKRGLLVRDETAKPQCNFIRGSWERPAVVQPQAHALLRKHPKSCRTH